MPEKNLMNEPDEVQLSELHRLINGKMYSACGGASRGYCIEIVIPYGTNKGMATFLAATKLFIRTAWRQLH